MRPQNPSPFSDLGPLTPSTPRLLLKPFREERLGKNLHFEGGVCVCVGNAPFRQKGGGKDLRFHRAIARRRAGRAPGSARRPGRQQRGRPRRPCGDSGPGLPLGRGGAASAPRQNCGGEGRAEGGEAPRPAEAAAWLPAPPRREAEARSAAPEAAPSFRRVRRARAAAGAAPP